MTVLLTAATPEYAVLADMVEPGKKKYAKSWGLSYKRVAQPEPYSCWDRPRLWLETLKNDRVGWMFWTGADVAITNLDVNPANFMPPFVDLTITADANGINNDVFFMRNSGVAREFLQRIIDHGQSMGSNDQEAMAAILAGVEDYPRLLTLTKEQYRTGGFPAKDRHIRELTRLFRGGALKVMLVEQKKLNAYPHHRYGVTIDMEYSWMKGDFMAHVPGLPVNDKVEAMKEILES